jgi:hypothetical protein
VADVEQIGLGHERQGIGARSMSARRSRHSVSYIFPQKLHLAREAANIGLQHFHLPLMDGLYPGQRVLLFKEIREPP